MPNKSPIEWTDYTSNAIYAVNIKTGKRGHMCTKPGPGCTNCYAEAINLRFGNGLRFHHASLDKVEFQINFKELRDILRIKKPSRIFVGDMTDIFQERISTDFIMFILATAAICPRHTFQLLTKRPERLSRLHEDHDLPAMIDDAAFELTHSLEFLGLAHLKDLASARLSSEWPLRNIHFGISAEDQPRYNQRVGYLQAIPAAVRWCSLEPLLSDIDCGFDGPNKHIDWIVAGSESGRSARVAEEQWFRSIKDQCVENDVPFFLKQFAEKGKKLSLPILDGQQWMQLPEVN